MQQDVPENQNSDFDDPKDDEWNPSFAWSDAQAMAYLAARWDQAGARAPRVVGRIRRMEGGFGFLTDLHQPDNGRRLLAPAEITSVHEVVFIPPQELQRLPPKPDDVEYAIAALEISPLARRQNRDDPLACSVRVGTLELLRRVPAEWGVHRMEGDSAPMLTELARQVIEAQLQDDTSAARDALDSVRAQLAEAGVTKTSLAAELALARQQLQESSTRIDEIEANAANRRAELEKRLTELTALLKEKGERMVALRLVEPEDLARLFPAKAADDTRPGHDFGKDLGEDWGRLASYVQTYLWQKGMHYTAAQLQDYLALLRTNDLIVLAGDSGSGKTSLVKSVAEALGGKCAVVPVKPNWSSSEDLMGYYNPIEQRFHPTQFLLALLDAAAEPDVPHFICLDEMNLARVEYYFADFLSLLESRDSLPWIHLYGTQEEQQTALDNRLFLKLEEEARNRSGLGPNATLEDLLLNDQANQELRKLAGFQEADTVLSHHARLRRAVSALIRLPSSFCFPPNVWILGAINVDETTHYLSPKILDRVHVMRFANPVLVDWESEASTLASFDLDMAMPVRMRAVEIGMRGPYPPFDRSQPDIAWLAELSKEFLDLLGIEFGLRAIRQSAHYLDKAQGCGINDAEALNNVLMHKVLPKLVVDVDKLAPTGEKRGDLLKRMAQFIGVKLQTMDEAPPDNASDHLQQMLVRAEANHGIVNFWAR